NLSSESCSSPMFLLAGPFFYGPPPRRGHFIIFLIVTGEKAEEKASSSPLNNSMIPVHAKSDFQLTHTERCTKNRQPRQLRVCSRGLLRIFCKLSEEIFTTPE
ncbi:hypothetical protein ACW9SC_004348, partial [Shigella flexneri]